MLELIIKFLAAYLIGNIMGGQVIGRIRGGIDLREVGSGNVGATNALRTQGKLFAVGVLLIGMPPRDMVMVRADASASIFP